MIGRGHLREVSNRWEGKIVDGKSDISPKDAQCIDILIDYFANSEEFEVAALLAEWKKVSDDEFIKKLEDFTNNGSYEVSEVEEEKGGNRKVKDLSDLLTRNFIEFSSVSLSVSDIRIIESGCGFSKEKQRSVHYIEINPRKHTFQKPTVKREFVLEEQRDRELELLKVKLSKFGIKFI